MLPVESFKDEILATVSTNSTVIITAETGAGKSTMVPTFLYEAGYNVIVTQPRILAAKTVAARVADVLGVNLGGIVGYHTGESRRTSQETAILFCTDGLQLVRELAGVANAGGKTILVLDEVHEWNTNMEVLVAWAKARQATGDDLKVVLMSATIEADQLSAFFDGAPVITVPGRTFPVTRSTVPTDDLENAVVRLAVAGHNVLVFQPGKKEINDTVERLDARLGGQADILPLHGEIDPADQMRCFAPPTRGRVKVVVATNVAQTSVTIPDIDAVVDSGMERRIELRDGIEGLHLLPISLADCDQRAGRAGRTKPGKYVLASDMLVDRPKFPVAEILRTRLDQMVLRLACQGFDATTLHFFHQPEEKALQAAKKSLIILGAMTENGEVTRIGHRMSRLPLAVTLARMLVEADRLGVTEQAATVAACLEAGNILARDGRWARLTTERKSDLLAILDVFRAGQAAINSGKGPKNERLRELGIFTRDFFRACELRRKILSVIPTSKVNISKGDERSAILQACVSGLVEHIYTGGYGGYRNGGPEAVMRTLAKESIVRDAPKMIVGLPFDISGKDKRDRPYLLRLVGTVSAVDVALVEQVAPHLVKTVTGKDPYYNPDLDCIRTTTERLVGDVVVESTMVDAPDHPEGPAQFAQWLCRVMTIDYMDVPPKIAEVVRANRATLRHIRDLAWSGAGTLRFSENHEIISWLIGQLPPGCTSVQSIPDPNVLLFDDLALGDLKEEIRFHKWKSLPRVPLYDPRNTKSIPEIRVEVYRHKDNGEPVYAYGALSPVWDGCGETRWFLNRAEAEVLHQSYIDAHKERQELEAAQALRAKYHEKVMETRRSREYFRLPETLRIELDNMLYRRAYTKEEALEQVETIKTLLAKAEPTRDTPPVKVGDLDLTGLASLGKIRQKGAR